MFRQSTAFTPPIHGSDTIPPPPQQQSSSSSPQPPSVSETTRRQQISASSSSSSPAKSHPHPHPLHNFPLSDLRWAMNHTNTHHHRLRKPSSATAARSPLRGESTNPPMKGNLVIDHEDASSSELRSEKKGDSAVNRSGSKSTTADGRSKIFIRIRTKNNEETPDIATTTTTTASVSGTDIAAATETDDSAGPAIDERICDGGGQEGDEFGAKTWNLRPRKPPPTKKRSIGNGGAVLKSCSGSLPEIRTQGTVRTEAIRSRNGADAKMAFAERKEKKPRLSISLSKLEIDEDIYALTGSKPSRRPKKRAKNIQKQLDVLFPGLWMGNVSSDAYKVSDHA